MMFAISCDCGHHEQPTSSRPQAATSTVSPPPPAPRACNLAPIPARLSGPKRVVAIGDLHGDLAATRSALRAAGAIGETDQWIGGDLVVVQTGDVLDRGDDESQIIELLDKLDQQARAAGGALIALIGNHELMNAAGDFRYVTPGGMRDFGGDRPHALGPGGTWAKRFAHHDVVMVVGDTAFSHAGILGDWVARIDEVNLSSRCWLDGQGSEPPAALTANDSPVWTRAYGIPGSADCAQLEATLAKLGAKRMVVGHTVQEHGITSDCGDKLWRIDVGLAKLYGGPIEVLEVSDPPKVLRGTR
ncbi:MAG: hypothetical protein JWO36_398 [Myxococcales bacterium]|nr:hypothetical protein [Myxococcales bacterium]